MSREDKNYWQRQVTRRQVLRGGMVAAVGGLGYALVGCGDDAAPPAATGTPAGTAAPVAIDGDDEEFRIGWLGSLTGVGVPYYVLVPNTLQMAVDEINAAGGFAGRPGRVILEDDATDPARGVEAVRKLINQDRVHATLSGQFSNIRYAETPELEPATVPMIYSAIFEGHFCSPIFYNMGETAGMVHDAIQKYLEANFGGSGFSVYHVGSDYIWSQHNDEIIDKFVCERGNELVGTELLPLGLAGVDLGTFASRINDARPDFIIDTTVGTDIIPVTKSIGDFGLRDKTKAYIHITVTENNLDALGDAAEGMLSVLGWFQSLDTPASKEFLDKYISIYGEPAAAMTVWEEAQYETAWMLKLATDKAGSIKGEDILNTFAAGGLEYDAPRGHISFDGKTNYAFTPLYLAEAKGGQFNILERLEDGDPNAADECLSTLATPVLTSREFTECEV